MVEGDPRLINVYHVIVATRARAPQAARAFADWLLRDDARRLIGYYGKERFGVSVYEPAALEPDSSNGSRP